MIARFASRAHRALRTRIRSTWARLRARRTTQQRLDRGSIRRVLVICYGNIYRSAFVGQYLMDNLRDSVEVRSAGFHQVVGRPSPTGHVAMSRQFGVDLSGHHSALVGLGDLEWADAIVLMDRHNWAALDDLGADPAKLVWLGALLPDNLEIADPYSMDPDAARAIVTRLHNAATALAEKLRR